jgi:hypothetical protein
VEREMQTERKSENVPDVFTYGSIVITNIMYSSSLTTKTKRRMEYLEK